MTAATRRRHRDRRGEAITGYLLVGPSLIGILAFLVFPILVVLWLSVHEWNIIGVAKFVGPANWIEVLSNGRIGNSLLVTLLYVLLVIPLQTALGLVTALLLARDLPGSVLFRTVFVLPWICAPLALGVVWKWIFAPTGGALNALIGTRIEWLSDPDLALPSVAAVAIWSNVGYVTLIFLAGLTAIPEPVIDAARLDGAGAFAITWLIKLPLLRPTTFFVLATGVISAAQTFDSVYALTGGGPAFRTDVIAGRIYAEAFQNANLGNAAVMALIMLVLLVSITAGQQLYFSRRGADVVN
ncbi:carbohydrate ABC transporter permease [Microlunatus sp. GCM10028923]|uniref:carbohydrate ABC transporter permease n=1 Tax=Microlunatus sp. GCM10028923 TaxID=3273400 RepID=UPI00361CA457